MFWQLHSVVSLQRIVSSTSKDGRIIPNAKWTWFTIYSWCWAWFVPCKMCTESCSTCSRTHKSVCAMKCKVTWILVYFILVFENWFPKLPIAAKQLVMGEYEVTDVAGHRVDYTIKDSKGHILSQKESVDRGKFSFSSESFETYEICFISKVSPRKESYSIRNSLKLL